MARFYTACRFEESGEPDYEYDIGRFGNLADALAEVQERPGNNEPQVMLVDENDVGRMVIEVYDKYGFRIR